MRFQICAYTKNLSTNKLRKTLQSCGFEPFRQNKWTKELRPIDDLASNIIEIGTRSEIEERDCFLLNTDNAIFFQTAHAEILNNLDSISEFTVKYFAT